MLITDRYGRNWWCPELDPRMTEEVKLKEIELSNLIWRGYEGKWNINPGARND